MQLGVLRAPLRPQQVGRGDRVPPGGRGRHTGEQSAGPQAVDRAAHLSAQVTVGHPGLVDRIADQLSVGSVVPQRHWQDPHERAIAVGPPACRSGLQRRHARADRAQRGVRLHADVEDPAVDGIPPLVLPGDQPGSKAVDVEPTVVEQPAQEHERLSAVVAPRARRHAGMRPPEAGRRGHLDRLERRDGSRRMELVGHAERVADEQPEQATAQSVACGDGHADTVCRPRPLTPRVPPAPPPRGQRASQHLRPTRQAPRAGDTPVLSQTCPGRRLLRVVGGGP